MKLPDVNARADGQLTGRNRQPHRLHEVAKMRVQHAAVVAEHNQLAGLVSRHQNARCNLVKCLRKAGRMNAPQRRRIARRRILYCFDTHDVMIAATITKANRVAL